jgi:nuclear pore complex protein Nup98-Nup96
LSVQKQQTKITTAHGVPFATIITDPAPVEFSTLAKAVAVDTAAGANEQHAWQLLSLLFDGADRIKKPADVDPEHIQRYRKERLSEFWRNLVYHDAQKHAQDAATFEERAIAQLSCNNVAEACHALVEGLDLRLATMVAQIGGDSNMRQTMSTQIEEWRRLDMLAEMEDAHRALYELVAGNCAQANGKLGNGRENKAATFNISSRFALDWRRAFGLRLWYGTLVDEPIEMAVAQFADAVGDGLEDVKPVPWFIRDNADMGWTDPDATNREDLLWGILKLYAATKLDIPANVEDVLAPENVSGHPLNARLSFQLFQLFYSRHRDEVEEPERKVGMPTVRSDSEGDFRRSFMSSTATVTNNDTQGADPLVELGDKITLSYAASLHTQAHWTTAIWAYTHLSSAPMREHYIRSLINQYVKSLNLADSDATYAYLTDELYITRLLRCRQRLKATLSGKPRISSRLESWRKLTRCFVARSALMPLSHVTTSHCENLWQASFLRAQTALPTTTHHLLLPDAVRSAGHPSELPAGHKVVRSIWITSSFLITPVAAQHTVSMKSLNRRSSTCSPSYSKLSKSLLGIAWSLVGSRSALR